MEFYSNWNFIHVCDSVHFEPPYMLGSDVEEEEQIGSFDILGNRLVGYSQKETIGDTKTY